MGFGGGNFFEDLGESLERTFMAPARSSSFRDFLRDTHSLDPATRAVDALVIDPQEKKKDLQAKQRKAQELQQREAAAAARSKVIDAAQRRRRAKRSTPDVGAILSAARQTAVQGARSTMLGGSTSLGV